MAGWIIVLNALVLDTLVRVKGQTGGVREPADWLVSSLSVADMVTGVFLIYHSIYNFTNFQVRGMAVRVTGVTNFQVRGMAGRVTGVTNFQVRGIAVRVTNFQVRGMAVRVTSVTNFQVLGMADMVTGLFLIYHSIYNLTNFQVRGMADMVIRVFLIYHSIYNFTNFQVHDTGCGLGQRIPGCSKTHDWGEGEGRRYTERWLVSLGF